MPKAPSSSEPRAPSSDPLLVSNGTNPNILKRNQACHQCRRRKLKCDAKRPCSTCQRSHRNLVKNSAPGIDVPPIQCTYDEADEASATAQPVPKNRYERLENRINELETLLRQKDVNTDEIHVNGTTSFSPMNSQFLQPTGSVLISGESFLTNDFISPLVSDSTFLGTSGLDDLDGMVEAHISPPSFDQDFSNFLDPSASTSAQGLSPPDATLNGTTLNSAANSDGNISSRGSPQASSLNQIVWSNWPDDLPSPDLLHHLVDAFFACEVNARQLFHVPTLRASLALPPSHAQFPHLAILHAICAVGSLYSAAIPPAPMPNFDVMPADEIFHNRHKRGDGTPDSFGEQQAIKARLAMQRSTSIGDRLLECLQANVALVWYYHHHARWADVYMMSGRALRAAVPLGINVCPPFHSISKALRAPSILPPPRTVIEDETRRNVFWLAYATERLHSSGNGWAMTIDDQDVSQLMPVRRDQFEAGTLVQPSYRQWAHGNDLLLTHPHSQTDSFILYIKAAILISRVKVFNLRFRARNYAGDSAMCPPPDSPNAQANGGTIDPRETRGFQDIDGLVAAFLDGIPRGFKHPVNNNIVDPLLFVVFMVPHVATILLHDPHADLKRNGCVSAHKILVAARGILDYTYAAWTTSYDITLLGTFCVFAWFLTGRVLVRFCKAAQDMGDDNSMTNYRSEVEFVRILLAKVGERSPLSYRYAKMLDDIVKKAIGDSPQLDFSGSLPRVLSAINNQQESIVHDAVQNSLDELLSSCKAPNGMPINAVPAGPFPAA